MTHVEHEAQPNQRKLGPDWLPRLPSYPRDFFTFLGFAPKSVSLEKSMDEHTGKTPSLTFRVLFVFHIYSYVHFFYMYIHVKT